MAGLAMLLQIIETSTTFLAYTKTKFHDLSPVVLMLGSPGSGDDALGERLEDYNIKHLSASDLVHMETEEPVGRYAQITGQNTAEGRKRVKTTVALLMKAMIDARNESNPALFLVSGFPCTLKNAKHFERTVSLPMSILRLKYPDNVLRDRLLAKIPEAGDRARTIRRRLLMFRVMATWVLAWYETLGLLVDVDANQEFQKVYEDATTVLERKFRDASIGSRK